MQVTKSDDMSQFPSDGGQVHVTEGGEFPSGLAPHPGISFREMCIAYALSGSAIDCVRPDNLVRIAIKIAQEAVDQNNAIIRAECEEDRKAVEHATSTDWRPFSSAPKVRPIIVWFNDGTGPGIAWWGFKPAGEGRWMSNYDDLTDNLPTHWQPLPDGPKESD